MGDDSREITGLALTLIMFAVIIAVTFGIFSYAKKTTESGEKELATALEEVKESEEVAKDTPAPTAKVEVTDNGNTSTDDELEKIFNDTSDVEPQADAQDMANMMEDMISLMLKILVPIIIMLMLTKIIMVALVYFMPAEMRESEFGHYIMRMAGKEESASTGTSMAYGMGGAEVKELDYEKIANKFMEVASPGIASKVVMAVCREAKLGDSEWQKIIKAMQGSNSVDDWLSKTTDDTLSVGLMSMPCISIGPSDITRKEVIDTYNKAINDINSGYASIDGYNRYHSTFLSEFFVYRVWNCNREVVAEPKFSAQANDDVADLMKKYDSSTDKM